ncbi:MAG: motility protein A [Syntrophales bacterium]
MIGQAICSILLLIAMFLLEFTMDVTEMGLASNLNALMIVLGGTFFATLIAYPWEKLVFTTRLLKKSFTGSVETASTIQTIVNLARIYRKKDIRSLEQEVNHLPPGLLKIGVELIAYKYSRENIEQILQSEAVSTYNQYATAHKILSSMARLAPALGLAGTIVSLIRIFGQISNPQGLIGYMAVALLCTFYGVILANLCFVPLANKLKEFMDQDELRMDMIQEGILDIHDQEHPRAVQYKLETLARALGTPDQTSARPKLVLLPPYEKAREING